MALEGYDYEMHEGVYRIFKCNHHNEGVALCTDAVMVQTIVGLLNMKAPTVSNIVQQLLDGRSACNGD